MSRLYRAKKLSSGLYKVVRPGDIFRFGRSQSLGPILISRQVFVLARNRYNSGSSLYFVRGGSVIISSDSVQGGILFLFNFAAGRDEWVIPSGKMPSGLYIVVRPEDILGFGIS